MTRIVMGGAYAVMIQKFISTEETRYYLNGFHVEANPAGGLLIVATDGHRMGVFHDELGTIEGPPVIVRLPKAAIGMLNKKPNSTFPGWTLVIEAGVARIHKEAKLTEKEVRTAHRYDGRDEGMAFSDILIDGTFPEWRRVVPELPKVRGNGIISVNAKYVGDFDAACGGAVSFLPGAGGAEGPIMIVGNRKDFVGVLMPIRSATKSAVPAFWTGISGPTVKPKPVKQAAE